jgi:hypothetical protein
MALVARRNPCGPCELLPYLITVLNAQGGIRLRVAFTSTHMLTRWGLNPY